MKTKTKQPMKRPMTGYTQRIASVLGVGEQDAHLVESLLRDQFGTLDHLDANTFDRYARKAQRMLDQSPELRRLVDADVFPGGIGK